MGGGGVWGVVLVLFIIFFPFFVESLLCSTRNYEDVFFLFFFFLIAAFSLSISIPVSFCVLMGMASLEGGLERRRCVGRRAVVWFSVLFFMLFALWVG